MTRSMASDRNGSTPVVCVNLNPSVDRTVVVEDLVLGAVNRTVSSAVAAGGKGAIVTRAVRSLGHDAVCVGPLGGESGQIVRRLASSEPLPSVWVPVTGETRTTVTIVAQHVGTGDTIVNEPGPTISSAEWDALSAAVSAEAAVREPVCICGSMPPGVSTREARRLVSTLAAAGARVFVDGHGEALRAMVDGGPACVKINHSEAAALAGRSVETVDDALAAAVALTADIELVVITLGARGAVAATDAGLRIHVAPPPITAVSSVGSGDAFLAGFVVGLHREHRSVVEAVQLGVGAGAANAMWTSQGVLDPQVVATTTRATVARVVVASDR